MTCSQIEKIIATLSKKKIELVIKDYASTLLKIEKKRKSLKLFLHKLFLTAPENILQAIVKYALETDLESLKLIKIFANDFFITSDVSSKIKKKNLIAEGDFYNLQDIYIRINERYFSNKLNLSITWFNPPKYKRLTTITLGNYDSRLKLIKINRILDDPNIPPYVVSSVIYHEILHYICSPKIDSKGRTCYHTKEFKEKEKLYPYFVLTKSWEKTQLNNFLKTKRKSYGRT